MTKLRKILNKLYITVQSFLLIISAGLLMCGAVAIFHDVFILKMDEKKACYLALQLSNKPKFDPSKPFEVVPDKTKFDPDEYLARVNKKKGLTKKEQLELVELEKKEAAYQAKKTTGNWRDRAIRIPSVEEAKKCGVSYRNPEKLNYPYIANRWADWVFDSRDNEYELIDRVQYEILLFFLYPLPLVLFLFVFRRWLVWMAKD